MAAENRKRHDPRREATRTALIEAAESLFAEAGVEGTSLRQIGAAIGSANVNVVAYHFGGKEELIREVYRHRLPDIDRRRRELLDEAEAAGTGTDLATLIRVFYQPLFEQTDSEGRHSYARFITGIERSGMLATRGQVNSEFPETNRVDDRIATCLPANLAPLLNTRRRLVAGLIANALLLIDREAADDPEQAEHHFANAVAMAAAAISAPAPATTNSRDIRKTSRTQACNPAD
ncbi:MAG: TetR family transcriptional regulator [Novosphingobium sp.]|nr:TetR family transcriptional regulator [Novosphingobium sp.]